MVSDKVTAQRVTSGPERTLWMSPVQPCSEIRVWAQKTGRTLGFDPPHVGTNGTIFLVAGTGFEPATSGL